MSNHVFGKHDDTKLRTEKHKHTLNTMWFASVRFFFWNSRLKIDFQVSTHYHSKKQQHAQQTDDVSILTLMGEIIVQKQKQHARIIILSKERMRKKQPLLELIKCGAYAYVCWCDCCMCVSLQFFAACKTADIIIICWSCHRQSCVVLITFAATVFYHSFIHSLICFKWLATVTVMRVFPHLI